MACKGYATKLLSVTSINLLKYSVSIPLLTYKLGGVIPNVLGSQYTSRCKYQEIKDEILNSCLVSQPILYSVYC